MFIKGVKSYRCYGNRKIIVLYLFNCCLVWGKSNVALTMSQEQIVQGWFCASLLALASHTLDSQRSVLFGNHIYVHVVLVVINISIKPKTVEAFFSIRVFIGESVNRNID